MGTAPLVGREAVHGAAAASFAAVPCAFEARPAGPNLIVAEERGGQDQAFGVLAGPRATRFAIGESRLAPDTVGWWLVSAFGLPTVGGATAKTNAFALADDPPSLSLRWTQRRRPVSGYEACGAVVTSFRVRFGVYGDLTYSGAGWALPATAIAPPAAVFPASPPLAAWTGAVSLGGAPSARLVAGWIELVRDRRPFFSLDNDEAPVRMVAGARTVRFGLVLDLTTTADYDLWRAAGTSALAITWTDPTSDLGGGVRPSLTMDLPRTAYGTAAVDDAGPLPLLRLEGAGMVDVGGAPPSSATLVCVTDYAA